jgi:hypothetical protein
MAAPHIYVIHLKHRTDRKKQFTEAWATAGLPTDRLHWFPAVLGTSLTDTTLANFRTAARTRKARAGRVGCFCSHVAAIEQALKHDHFPLLILEDDAVPTPQTPDLTTLFADAPSEARLLYFGAIPIRQRKTLKNYCGRRKGWHIPRSDVRFYTTHAYGLPDADAANEVRDFLNKTKITLDSAYVRYQKEHRDRVAVYCPFVFHQSEGYSDIEGTSRGRR